VIRREFVRLGSATAGLALLSTACGLSAPWARQRIPRIGYGSYGPRDVVVATYVDPFLKGLRELGYVEGETITIEWRFTSGDSNDEFNRIAQELVSQSVDLIVANFSNGIALAAKQLTTTIPIVAVAVPTAIEEGLVTNLSHPGGNVTALTVDAPGAQSKFVDLLRDVVLDLSHVALLLDTRAAVSASAATILDQFRAAVDAAGLAGERVGLGSVDDLESAFASPAMGRSQAFVSSANGLLINSYARLAEVAIQHRLPGISNRRPMAEAGLLMSYGPNLATIARRAAIFVDKILKGARAGDLPVEQPTAFDLVVNVKTLQALGLTIPPSVQPLVTEWIQ
jgi:putative ABC transport system substrate-binding protein